jgi:hypothetical protein
MIPVRERRYADARTTRRGNTPSADGVDCGASLPWASNRRRRVARISLR